MSHRKAQEFDGCGKGLEGKVLLENSSPKKGLVTRFACDSPCVIFDDILCDFCFDIFPPGFMRAVQGAPGGERPGQISWVRRGGWRSFTLLSGYFVATRLPALLLFIYLFFVFLPFLGLHLQHMAIPRLGVELEL